MIEALPTSERYRWPTTFALLDLWRAPYSGRLTRYLAFRMRRNGLRGLPSILD
jgi:hypothetical protein